MRTSTKIWLIVATSLILAGSILFTGVMTSLDWNFEGLATNKFDENRYEIYEPFKNISIESDTADIVFIPSETASTSVVCNESDSAKHLVTVEGENLVIRLDYTRKWYNYIGITFSSPKITVYLPEGEYGELSVKTHTGDIIIPNNFTFNSVNISLSTGDVIGCASSLKDTEIKTSTGDIRLENLSAASLDLTVSTGRVTLCDITCDKFTSKGDTGKISMENVIVTEKLSVERSTGDVKFEKCDAAEIFIETDTGDVKGSLLSDKVFITKTDTGDITVPDTLSGGRCEITTDTGDINITIN